MLDNIIIHTLFHSTWIFSITYISLQFEVNGMMPMYRISATYKYNVLLFCDANIHVINYQLLLSEKFIIIWYETSQTW